MHRKHEMNDRMIEASVLYLRKTKKKAITEK